MINKFFLCLVTCCTVTLGTAQNQFLDTSFGTNGVHTYTPNSSYGFIYETGAITSQNKIIVSGSFYAGPYANHTTNVIQRLNADGTIDNSFNAVFIPPSSGGIVTSRLIRIGIQSNQKIILGDLLGQKLIRLNENGTYDTGFGTNGVVKTSLFEPILDSLGLVGFFNLKSMLLTNNNKTLICIGVTDDVGPKLAVFRLNENGSIDNSFGVNGLILQDGGSGNLTIQSDFKLVLIGQKYDGTILKSRYSENGILDSTYNNNSLQYTPISGYAMYFLNTLTKNNTTYLYGFAPSVTGQPTIITLIKLNQYGEFDNSFGTNGVVNEPHYNNNNNYYVDNNGLFPILLSDSSDNIFVVCTTSPTTVPINLNHFIKKFKSNGVVDQNFGNNGIVDIDLNYKEYMGSAIMTPNQNILIFGNHQTPNKGIISKILNNNNVLAVDNLNKENFRIYPNPVEDFININNLKNPQFSTAQILDVNGRVIITAEIENNRIDVKSLLKGVYFLRIGDMTNKFIKK